MQQLYATESDDELCQQYRVLEREHDRITKYYATQLQSQIIRVAMWKRKFLLAPIDSSYLEGLEWFYKEWMKEWDTWRAWILAIRRGMEAEMDGIGIGNTRMDEIRPVRIENRQRIWGDDPIYRR